MSYGEYMHSEMFVFADFIIELSLKVSESCFGIPEVEFRRLHVISESIREITSWEQRKLGDLMDVGSVKRVHKSDWRDSGIRFLRARDVVADFKNEAPDDYLYIDQKMYEEYSALSGKVQRGDLLVTGVGTIGIPMLIKSEEPVYFKDGNIIWFQNRNSIDGQFFYYAFTSKGIQDFVKESAGTGTVGTYTIDSGKKTPINLPKSKDEQEKIGSFFSDLDKTITLHQRWWKFPQQMRL